MLVWSGKEWFDLPEIHCPLCRNYAWHFSTMRPVFLGGHPHHPQCPMVRAAQGKPYPRYPKTNVAYPANNVGFGGHVPMSTVLRSGLIIGTVAKVLGAGLPGAAVMGFAAALSEAGSGNIPWGWKRWVLGLFSKPEH